MALVAHWKLDENAANADVADAVGAVPHDGTANANTNVLHAPGKVGSGSFDFDTQYAVEVNDHAALSFDDSGANPFSMTAWVFVTTLAANQSILTKYDETAPGHKEYLYYINDTGKLLLRLFDQSAGKTCVRTTDAVIPLGWHLLTATYDSTGGALAANGIKLYVDNREVASTATNDADYVAMENKDSKVRIGAYWVAALAGFMQDKMDDVRLYNHVLTQFEINKLYSENSGRSPAMWKLILGY